MLLRTCQLSRIICFGIEELRTAHRVVGTNHITKRYAGHSQYQNRKQSKEAGSLKRSQTVRKYQFEMDRVIKATKDANPATNSRLQAVLGEAMKNNVPKATLEKFLKVAASTLSRDCINQFAYVSPNGIIGIIEVSSLQREHAKSQTTSVTKKFGFQIANNVEMTITTVGIITCKPIENVKDPLDKALEDAITANCEEVTETDDKYIEFQCHANHIDSCVKKLTELGYTVENSESRFVFPELVEIDDEDLLRKLDKMEEKLESLPGFVRVVYNIK